MNKIKYSDGCDLLTGLSDEYCMWQWGQMVHYLAKMTVTTYLVSFLNLLNRVQSCNDSLLLLGASCEDHPLMKSYSNYLREEMEQIETEITSGKKWNRLKGRH